MVAQQTLTLFVWVQILVPLPKSLGLREPRLFYEVWLSLVERYVRDVEVAGSNPVTSTTWLSLDAVRVLDSVFCFAGVESGHLAFRRLSRRAWTHGAFQARFFFSSLTQVCSSVKRGRTRWKLPCWVFSCSGRKKRLPHREVFFLGFLLPINPLPLQKGAACGCR